ncbi:MAG: hypothetical protein RLN75_05160, partial [Longimicrobiales bacterium]
FGGTVAKTSFLIIAKDPEVPAASMLLAEARHVGFLKRGNRRIADPAGNDLHRIVEAFLQSHERSEVATGIRWVEDWRHWDRLGIRRRERSQALVSGELLGDLVTARRVTTTVSADSTTDIHVSVLDIDPTGFIALENASTNRPVSRVLEVEPGDVLVSCLNPKIWRATVIPDLPGRWTASPEFAVLRPRPDVDPWELALRLHTPEFIESVQMIAGGTSSSRQRADKDELLHLALPGCTVPAEALSEFRKRRLVAYETRLMELQLFAQIHEPS